MPDPTKKELNEQSQRPSLAPFQLYRLREVAAIVGVHPRTIQRWMEELDFPQPLKVGKSAIRWRGDEIEAWVEGRPRKESSELQRWDAMIQQLEAMGKGLR